MHGWLSSAGRRLSGDPVSTPRASQVTMAAAVVLVLAQLAFRAWAVFPSWFYLDDYHLLRDAQTSHGVGDLLAPYNGHLMPGGRLLVLWVESSGQLNWTLAATSTLGLQLVASVSAVWMLVTLFGARPATIGPLALYLFSPMTLPAFMWWTACLSQITMQAGFFLAVAAWVLYLRTHRARWVLAALAGVTFAILFDVKGVLIVPVLAFVATAYFATGSVRHRITSVARGYWPGLVAGSALLIGYLAIYTLHVSSPFQAPSLALVRGLSAKMLGTAFTTALLGGPWDWSAVNPPNAFADPPATAVHLTWVIIALVVCYSLLTRVRAVRAWLLVVGYLVVLLALLATSRGPDYGPIIGLEYRYLTDAICVVCLAVGLAFLPLLSAVESSGPRTDLLNLRVRWPVIAGATALVVVSSLVSSVRYVDIWHTRNASKSYTHRLEAELRTSGSTDLADAALPDEIIPGIFAPDNALRRFVPLLSDRARFPAVSDQLTVIASDGSLRRALIKPGVVSKRGPVEDCGWRVTSRGRDIPLGERAFDWTWWIRIGYLSNGPSPMTVTAGRSQATAQVARGIHSLYVHVAGSFDHVRLDGLTPGTIVCVDTIEVGQPVPGGAL